MPIYSSYLAYAFALLLAIPFLILLRQGLHFYMRTKEQELKWRLSQKGTVINTQAYERMAIFLERIKPANIIKNFDTDLAPHEFIFLTEKSINQEFEYNISQQIYFNKDTWDAIAMAKNEVIKQLKLTYENLNTTTPLDEFKTVFIMKYMEGEDHVGAVLELLRKEIKNNQKH